MENFNFSREGNVLGDIFINVGTGEEISMFDLSLLVAETVGYTGKIS